MGHVKRFILEKNFNQLLEEISRIVDNELYVGQIIIGCQLRGPVYLGKCPNTYSISISV